MAETTAVPAPEPTLPAEPKKKSPFGGGGGKSGTFGFLTQQWGPMPAYVWLGGVFAVVYVGMKLKNKLTGSGGAPDAAGEIDPATGLPYQYEAYDVASGATYASKYQTLQEQVNSSLGQDTGVSPGQKFATNSDWSTAAVNYLVSIGYSGAAATKAIQDYLTGQPPTAADQQMVDAAIKYLGAPPQQPTPAGGTAPLPPPPVTKPPDKKPPEPVVKPKAVTGLKPTHITKDSITWSWNKVPNAKGYRLYFSSWATKKRFVDELGGNTTTWTHGGLHPGKDYTVYISAHNAAGTSAEVQSKAVTKKK